MAYAGRNLGLGATGHAGSGKSIGPAWDVPAEGIVRDDSVPATGRRYTALAGFAMTCREQRGWRTYRTDDDGQVTVMGATVLSCHTMVRITVTIFPITVTIFPSRKAAVSFVLFYTTLPDAGTGI